MVEKVENNASMSKGNHGSFLYIIGFLLLIFSVLLISSIVNAIIILTSYICGFLFCYLVLKFKCQCLKYVCSVMTYFGIKQSSEEFKLPESPSPKIGCSVCGGTGCSRHLESSEPWESLHIHKQLDQAIEDFYNVILNQFVSGWYTKITSEQSLLIELRFLLRFSSSSLLKRALKINIGQLITSKLVPCALSHYAVCIDAQRLMATKGYKTLQEAAIDGPLRYSLHPAVTNRETELEYLKSITRAIIPYLLPKEELDSKLLNILIREIFSGWVLLSLTDILSDPGIINTLVILATSDIKLSKLPEFPKHQVEFLANFVVNDNYKRLRLLNVDVSEIIKNREYLYAFMQYLKSVGKIHLLQFCMDIDEFNKKMLKPDLKPDEQVALFNNAWDIYLMYFVRESPSYISFSSENVDQLKTILSEGVSNITKLQTSKALYQAYDHVFTLLDQVWAPKFFDTEDFYKIIFGARPSKEYVKKNLNKKTDKSNTTKVGNQLSKLKGALKSDTLDGQILESVDSVVRIGDVDSLDGTDVELQYSDILADYAKLKERDLSTWRVSIENVKEKKANNKTGMKHLFTISVLKIDPLSLGNETRWTVDRTDTDFHTLKAKLVEFHGEVEMGDASVPSKRVKAAAEVRKKKYEVFLQNLLLKPLLKSSDLLHLFLTAEDDFASLAEQARPGFSIVPDLGNIYQTVTHKLRKEKGQHLDTFMNTFLISTDVDYYQPFKEDSTKEIDNGEEAIDILSFASCGTADSYTGRCITNGVFGNNFGLQGKRDMTLKKKNFKAAGFTRVFSFLLSDVFKVREPVIGIAGTICNLGASNIDEAFDKYLTDILCTVLSPPRLAHLIKLGQAILFEDKVPLSKKSEPCERWATAKCQLQMCFPYLLTSLLGPNFLKGVDDLFEFLQHPLLNKQVENLIPAAIINLNHELYLYDRLQFHRTGKIQPKDICNISNDALNFLWNLIYNLLDIILAELFPELENVT